MEEQWPCDDDDVGGSENKQTEPDIHTQLKNFSFVFQSYFLNKCLPGPYPTPPRLRSIDPLLIIHKQSVYVRSDAYLDASRGSCSRKYGILKSTQPINVTTKSS